MTPGVLLMTGCEAGTEARSLAAAIGQGSAGCAHIKNGFVTSGEQRGSLFDVGADPHRVKLSRHHG